MFFLVIHRRTSRTIYTNYHIQPHEWDEMTSSIRVTGTRERQSELQLWASQLQWDIKRLTDVVAEKETICWTSLEVP